ncbi:MAG TPA: phosphoglycerate kinase [Pirellulales bacterium]|nr:phosphoglycerate kinase [Pirellulales bacterium]
MAVTRDSMLAWCETLLGVRERPWSTLADYLAAVPRLKSLADVPSGTPVLVRGDVDAKPGAKIGEGDIRLRSMVETLKFGRDHGWKQIVFGHIGRKPEQSLGPIGKRLGELLGISVPLVIDWFDESTSTIRDRVQQQIAAAAPGSVLLLENARQYDIERVLWKAKPDDLPRLAEPLAKLANEFAAKVAKVYVNEGLSAGSLDSSSTIVPAAMQRVALGAYVAEQFDGPMMRCLAAQLVVFSGIKIDKLDDLEAVIGRGSARVIFTAGSLAMALKKADAELAGKSCSLGVAEDPAHGDKPYFIPRERIEQAKRMLTEGRKKGIEFVLPIDSILQHGQASDTIGPQDQQFDIGPKSSAVFAEAIGRFIAAASKDRKVAFHNGVFGMFEDARFEEGTRKFIGELKRLKDAGVEVYIGGGEGGTALERYGQPDHVTHTFTAGGTVLNALGSEPVPYLVALAMAARQEAKR